MLHPIDSYDRFVSLESKFSEIIQKSLDRRTSVFVSPTLSTSQINYDGVKFSKKYRDLLTLIILTWYSDYFREFAEYVRYEIQLHLDQTISFPELNASLVSKSCLNFVIAGYVSVHGPNDFFGNVLSPVQINRVLDLVHLKILKPRKVKRPVYRRGYKDKGSLRPETRWLPREDYTFVETQNLIEQKREEYQNQVTRIVRASGDWVLKHQVIRKEE
jgi:hypothetical protein